MSTMDMHSTTILAVRKNGQVAMAGDGQVSLGNTIMKGNARKVRTLAGGKIIAGFAGSAADGFTLFERYEAKLAENNGDMARAAVELAKDWRMDRALRRLEAMIILANKDHLFVLSGNGDLIEPETDAIAIGSGGNYAYAAALAYMEDDKISAKEVVTKSLKIASSICVFTNDNLVVEEIA